MLKLILKTLAIICFYFLPALSENYNNILIKGNERISDKTIIVFSEIPSKKFLDEASLNSILKNLYNSNFFNDVIVKIEDQNLIIEVNENPIIQTVFIEGIPAKKIEEKIVSILLLKNRSSFNINFVKNDEIAILNLLKDMGYYFSTLISSIEELNDNKINLTYSIVLGDKAKISKITFLGDKKFKDRVLRNVIVSEEYKFWKIVSGGKFLNENLVNYDKKLLKNFYMNNGFYNVNIESSYATFLGEDKFELIYNISPGKKYLLNDLTLKLPIDYDASNFKKLNLMLTDLKGQMYALDLIENILDEIDKTALIEEYQFLEASVIESVDDNLINLTFDIKESKKLYVEKINIFGNNVTREEVIRNNLYVDEGDAFNELLHTKSINNIKSLNIFSKVDSKVVTGTSDKQKIINISIDEKATGEITAGAGVGSSGGTIGFGVTENNFLGRGIEFGTQFKISKESIRGQLALNNPNFQGTNRSLNL